MINVVQQALLFEHLAALHAAAAAVRYTNGWLKKQLC